MNIGDLNRRIEVLQFFEDRDDYGGVDGEWLPVGRVWAKIEPGSGTEYFAKQQVNAENENKDNDKVLCGYKRYESYSLRRKGVRDFGNSRP